MTGATFSSDLTRFVKKPSYVWFVTVGSFLCVTVLETVGLMCSLGTGESNLVTILAKLNMSVSGFWYLFIINNYQADRQLFNIAALALENITKVIRGREGKESDGKFTTQFFVIPSCIFGGIIAIMMTANDFTSTFSSWLASLELQFPQSEEL